MKIGKFLSLLVVMGSLAFGASYSLDYSHTSVGFKIRHLMISNVQGTFGVFNGSLEYDKKTNKLTSIKGSVETATIDTDNKKRDDHLRSADFFDAKHYEFITFESTKFEGDYVWADFTIKGITKNVKFEVEDLADIVGPRGKHRIGFTLEGEINRKDFGLTWNKVLESGGLVVGDEVKIIAEIQAIQKD